MADRTKSDGNTRTREQRPARLARWSRWRRDAPAPRPWRTEGLPEDGQGPQKPGWWRLLAWFLMWWLLLFTLTTLQDVGSAQVASVPYTEFTDQVRDGNVDAADLGLVIGSWGLCP